jgi:hypothetical protein
MTITLSVGQLLLLLLLMAVLVAVFGGLLHHETGNPKSHGRMAYALAVIAVLAIGTSAVTGLHLPRLAWHSFDAASRSSQRAPASFGRESGDDSLWKSGGRRHL